MLKENKLILSSISEGIDTHLPTGEAWFPINGDLSAMECAN